MSTIDYGHVNRRAASLYEATASDWATTSLILPAGMVGRDTTTGTYKLGDGVHLWGALSAIGSGGGGSSLAHYPATYEEWLLNGSPSGTFRQNMPRRGASGNSAALTSGVMTAVALYLEAGDTVTNLTFISGGTQANVPADWWFALYDTAVTPNLLVQTADQGTGAWGANTTKTLPLSTPYVVTATGLYRAAVMVNASTVPTLLCSNSLAKTVGGILTGQIALSVSSGSALTSTAPATLASPSATANIPYCIAT